MPREISPEDLEKLENVYIDESSQTDHRSLVIGGIVIPRRLSELFSETILEARRPRLAAERPDSSELREMKWSEVGRGKFDAYKRVVDAYFGFAEKHIAVTEKGVVAFYCTIILTQVPGRSFTGTQGKKALDEEFYWHCHNLALYHEHNLFHIHLDSRYSDDKASATYDKNFRNRLCRDLAEKGTRRNFAARGLKSWHSHELQGLQIADLLIGGSPSV